VRPGREDGWYGEGPAGHVPIRNAGCGWQSPVRLARDQAGCSTTASCTADVATAAAGAQRIERDRASRGGRAKKACHALHPCASLV